jgi:hypothetical protein
MAFEVINNLDTVQTMDRFIEKVRPPAELRDQLDISYRIEKQSVIIFEIRQNYIHPGFKIDSPIAKATFVKSDKVWKIYWMRADMKWHSYTPKPVVGELSVFLKTVEEDKHNCFWG